MSVTIQQPVEVLQAARGATRADYIKLRSTGGPIPDSIGSLRSFSKDTPVGELREAYRRDGYIWIKGLLPVEDVLKCRESYFTYLSDTGLLKEGTSPRDGIYCGADWRMWIGPGKLRRKFGQVQDTAYTRKMVAAHSASSYREFCDHPDMKDFIERFSGWSNASLLKRSLLRPNIPGGEITQVSRNLERQQDHPDSH
jgi:phytanoyl-CoA hydroxylase